VVVVVHEPRGDRGGQEAPRALAPGPAPTPVAALQAPQDLPAALGLSRAGVVNGCGGAGLARCRGPSGDSHRRWKAPSSWAQSPDHEGHHMFEHVQFPKDLLSWIEDHHGLASWVEALGVIVAIFGSVRIARWQDQKVRRREHDQRMKKAKVVLGCFAPMLRMIESDVRGLTAVYRSEGRKTVQELRRHRFQELPSSASFVLENAHLLPGDGVISVPQLLVFRELVGKSIDGLARGHPEQVLSDEGVRDITTWLDLMQGLVDEIYDLIKDVHDTPITKLLEEGEG
jgi:hypothetical protein